VKGRVGSGSFPRFLSFSTSYSVDGVVVVFLQPRSGFRRIPSLLVFSLRDDLIFCLGCPSRGSSLLKGSAMAQSHPVACAKPDTYKHSCT
jgi:hypothetical protein